MSLSVNLPDCLLKISKALALVGGKAILVGGCVRDAYLGIPAVDFDIEVFGLTSYDTLLDVLRSFGDVILVGDVFSVAKLRLDGVDYDFSFPRRERKTGDKHRDFDIEADGMMSFEEAASRRDFTMNAMGYVIETGEFLDPFDGRGDLGKKVLRHVGPRFVEDALRVFRAVQLAARFELDIAPETIALCREISLDHVSDDRKWMEARKLLLLAKKPMLGILAAEKLGILTLAEQRNGVLAMMMDYFGMPESVAKKVERSWRPKKLVLGRHLLEMGIVPGVEMGKLLKKAYEAQLAGEFDSVEGGMAWIRGRQV
jgi:tRNA nucleotidyltransferase (CCA-adding enzyme)